jgi:transposase
MSTKQQLSDFEKGRVIGLREAGNSIRKIAEILHSPKTTIWQVISKYQKTGTTARTGVSGRRSSLNAANLAHIEKIVRENQKKAPQRFLRK